MKIYFTKVWSNFEGTNWMISEAYPNVCKDQKFNIFCQTMNQRLKRQDASRNVYGS